MNLYAPLDPIVSRLKDRLKAQYSLREIYTETSLADLQIDAVEAPSIAVMPASFVIRDVDVESGTTMVETRWLVVPVIRPINDRGRATRARDAGGEVAVETISHLSSWLPAPGYGGLMLRQVPPPREVKGKLFIPLLFGSVTTIEATP